MEFVAPPIGVGSLALRAAIPRRKCASESTVQVQSTGDGHGHFLRSGAMTMAARRTPRWLASGSCSCQCLCSVRPALTCVTARGAEADGQPMWRMMASPNSEHLTIVP